jgi:hypothetical protein
MCKDTKSKKSNLMRRANSKYISRGSSRWMRDNVPNSPLTTSYKNTFFCAANIALREGKLISSYCKNRWCPVCNRIRTAKAINSYKPQLEQFKDPYFVTLTATTVYESELSLRITDMQKTWRLLTNLASVKKRKDFKGVRSLECTSRPQKRFHPHFHLIIEGEDNATWLVDQWLKRLGKKASRKAQDIRKADMQSYSELFKYATKLSALTGKGKTEAKVPAIALDVIYRFLRGKRLFQPFGGVKKATARQENELFGQDKPEGLQGHLWTWIRTDWVETTTGEVLTGYRPSERVKKLWSLGEEELPN